jgi:hypothetical protein
MCWRCWETVGAGRHWPEFSVNQVVAVDTLKVGFKCCNSTQTIERAWLMA